MRDALRDAMARWQRIEPLPAMTALGVAVTATETVISRRHGATWFDEIVVRSHRSDTVSANVAGHVVEHVRDESPVHVLVLDGAPDPAPFLQMLQHERIDRRQAEAMVQTLVQDLARNPSVALPPDAATALSGDGRDPRALALGLAWIHAERTGDILERLHADDREHFPYDPRTIY